MAGKYVLPFQIPSGPFSGSGCGNNDVDPIWGGGGGGGGGCGYCYPGEQTPLPSWFNPWEFCITDYPEYSD